MKVLRVGFVGTRSADVPRTTAFFRDVLGLETRRDDDTWGILQLPTGRFDFLEIFDESFDDERYAPADTPLFVAFIVDDIESAHREVLAAGAETSPIVWARDALQNPALGQFAWFVFRAPDGRTYVMEQTPD